MKVILLKLMANKNLVIGQYTVIEFSISYSVIFNDIP